MFQGGARRGPVSPRPVQNSSCSKASPPRPPARLLLPLRASAVRALGVKATQGLLEIAVAPNGNSFQPPALQQQLRVMSHNGGLFLCVLRPRRLPEQWIAPITPNERHPLQEMYCPGVSSCMLLPGRVPQVLFDSAVSGIGRRGICRGCAAALPDHSALPG